VTTDNTSSSPATAEEKLYKKNADSEWVSSIIINSSFLACCYYWHVAACAGVDKLLYTIMIMAQHAVSFKITRNQLKRQHAEGKIQPRDEYKLDSTRIQIHFVLVFQVPLRICFVLH
jgi:hypothetical protein